MRIFDADSDEKIKPVYLVKYEFEYREKLYLKSFSDYQLLMERKKPQFLG